MVWAGDDWSDSITSPAGDRVGMKKVTPKRGTRAPAGKKRDFSSPSSSSALSSGERMVKIRMPKKELEKLLKEVDMNLISLEQVMARLAGASDDFSFSTNCHHRSWRPALQSIPEVS